MTQILMHQTVEDYAQWKPIFDERSAIRGAAGSRGYRLLRRSDNPNDLFIIFDWENEAKAREYTSSDDLKAAMQRAGVVSVPEIYILEEIETRDEGTGEHRLEKTA